MFIGGRESRFRSAAELHLELGRRRFAPARLEHESAGANPVRLVQHTSDCIKCQN